MMTEDQRQLLSCLVKADSIYQELLQACLEAEQGYLEVRHKLSPSDQEKLDKYLALCEEMEYRRVCLACQISAK